MTSAPTISIVTPVLNQAGMVRHAIESVACNNQHNVEHIVIDGGSTDGTLEILSEYPDLIVFSGEDAGPYDAVNQGFKSARGDVLAWLNADDFYVPHALDTVAAIFRSVPEIDWLTTQSPLWADAAGRIVGGGHVACYSPRRALWPDAASCVPRVSAVLQQESTFWRRSLWESCGAALANEYDYAADYELWLRFWKATRLTVVSAPLGCFRWTDNQRSRVFENEYRAEVAQILSRHGGGFASKTRTLVSRAALACRGLPQQILRICPFACAQEVVSFDRDSANWRLTRRYGIPS